MKDGWNSTQRLPDIVVGWLGRSVVGNLLPFWNIFGSNQTSSSVRSSFNLERYWSLSLELKTPPVLLRGLDTLLFMLWKMALLTLCVMIPGLLAPGTSLQLYEFACRRRDSRRQATISAAFFTLPFVRRRC
jgi:hypothetical protein